MTKNPHWGKDAGHVAAALPVALAAALEEVAAAWGASVYQVASWAVQASLGPAADGVARLHHPPDGCLTARVQLRLVEAHHTCLVTLAEREQVTLSACVAALIDECLRSRRIPPPPWVMPDAYQARLHVPPPVCHTCWSRDQEPVQEPVQEPPQAPVEAPAEPDPIPTATPPDPEPPKEEKLPQIVWQPRTGTLF